MRFSTTSHALFPNIHHQVETFECFLVLCDLNEFLDPTILSQRLQENWSSFRWFASMWFFIFPFCAPFPHTLQTYARAFWLPTRYWLFSIKDATLASRSSKSNRGCGADVWSALEFWKVGLSLGSLGSFAILWTVAGFSSFARDFGGDWKSVFALWLRSLSNFQNTC